MSFGPADSEFYEEPYDDEEFEDDGYDPELADLEARVEGLRQRMGVYGEEDEPAFQHIDAHLEALEDATGQAIPEETANLIGRLALEYADENGVPDVEAALEHMLTADASGFEGEFDARVPQLEKRLGREITDTEVQELWESAVTKGDSDPVAAWGDVHPDGKDPLKGNTVGKLEAYIQQSFDRQKAEEDAAEPDPGLDENGRRTAETLDGAEVRFNPRDDHERRAAMAEVLESTRHEVGTGGEE